jgi:outer membrane scaffolding protein for murein synthesis (MipA/OmpV family)
MTFATKLTWPLILAFTLLLVTVSSKAQDSNLRSESPHFSEEGWDFRIGGGLTTTSGQFYQGMKNDNGLTALLEASYIRGNFFFNANDEDGLLFGYSLLRDDDWVLDAVFGPKFGVNFDDSDMFDDQLKTLHNRAEDGQLGARFTWYGDTNRMSISLTRDIVGAHGGYLGQLDYQQEWQLRNWLLTGRVGLLLFSQKMTDHMVGVSAEEATATISEFKADAGYGGLMELTVEYPVNEHVVFESRATLIQGSSQFSDSPIVKDDAFAVFTTGFKYQF